MTAEFSVISRTCDMNHMHIVSQIQPWKYNSFFVMLFYKSVDSHKNMLNNVWN